MSFSGNINHGIGNRWCHHGDTQITGSKKFLKELFHCTHKHCLRCGPWQIYTFSKCSWFSLLEINSLAGSLIDTG